MSSPVSSLRTATQAPHHTALDQARIDLAAALRWAARLGFNEGVCNHFSVEVADDRYLINP